MKHITGDSASFDASKISIALVVSRFNEEITQALMDGAIERLQERGIAEHALTLVEVPGAVEIPLTVKKLLQLGRFDAVIALGAVIRGDTTHYDYVCQQVSDGCQRVMLMHDVPVVFGILTTENEAQAWDRLGGSHGHKGRDAADCALSMHSILRQIT